jgi:hypothetical protein
MARFLGSFVPGCSKYPYPSVAIYSLPSLERDIEWKDQGRVLEICYTVLGVPFIKSITCKVHSQSQQYIYHEYQSFSSTDDLRQVIRVIGPFSNGANIHIDILFNLIPTLKHLDICDIPELSYDDLSNYKICNAPTFSLFGAALLFALIDEPLCDNIYADMVELEKLLQVPNINIVCDI